MSVSIFVPTKHLVVTWLHGSYLNADGRSSFNAIFVMIPQTIPNAIPNASGSVLLRKIAHARRAPSGSARPRGKIVRSYINILKHSKKRTKIGTATWTTLDVTGNNTVEKWWPFFPCPKIKWYRHRKTFRNIMYP